MEDAATPAIRYPRPSPMEPVPVVAPEALQDSITRVSVEVSEAAHVLATCRRNYYAIREDLQAAEARFSNATAEMGKLIGAMTESGKG
jgi:hypothetical protein